MSGAILLAIVPTNIVTCLVLMARGLRLVLASHLPARLKWAGALILCTPMLGLATYVGIWPQVLAASNRASAIGARWAPCGNFINPTWLIS